MVKVARVGWRSQILVTPYPLVVEAEAAPHAFKIVYYYLVIIWLRKLSKLYRVKLS